MSLTIITFFLIYRKITFSVMTLVANTCPRAMHVHMVRYYFQWRWPMSLWQFYKHTSHWPGKWAIGTRIEIKTKGRKQK